MLPRLLYFNFKTFKDPNSLSFIRFQCILDDSGEFFSDFWSFYKLKWGHLFSGGNQFCRKSELFGPPFCIWILKVSVSQILCHSLDINAFCLNQDSFFSESSNFYKLRRADLISGGRKFCRKSELFRPPFSFPILQVLRFQILCHSTNQSLETSAN